MSRPYDVEARFASGEPVTLPVYASSPARALALAAELVLERHRDRRDELVSLSTTPGGEPHDEPAALNWSI